MICDHFLRSHEKLVLVVASSRRFASPESITSPQHGDALQPFCGALISTSTPASAMSTQIAPEATQSRTNSAPTSCAALPTARR